MLPVLIHLIEDHFGSRSLWRNGEPARLTHRRVLAQLKAQHIGVEYLCLVLVIDENTDSRNRINHRNTSSCVVLVDSITIRAVSRHLTSVFMNYWYVKV